MRWAIKMLDQFWEIWGTLHSGPQDEQSPLCKIHSGWNQVVGNVEDVWAIGKKRQGGWVVDIWVVEDELCRSMAEYVTQLVRVSKCAADDVRNPWWDFWRFWFSSVWTEILENVTWSIHGGISGRLTFLCAVWLTG